jgi:hypothetical protein
MRLSPSRFLLIFQLWLAARDIVLIEYSEFLTYLEDGKVASLVVTETEHRGTFTEARRRQDGLRHHTGRSRLRRRACGIRRPLHGAHDQTWLTTLCPGSFQR